MSTERLRVAFIVHDCHRRGGQARYVAELATRFRREHEVHVFANTFDVDDADGITVHWIPAWRRNALTTILTFILPATLAVDSRFDIIHAQGLCGLFHNVVTAHFCQAGWHAAIVQPTWKQKLVNALIAPLERFAITKSGTHRVVAISEKIKDDLDRFYNCRKGVSVVYHGVDLESFHPRNRQSFRDEVRRELRIPPEALVALFVGNLQKGAAAALQTVARVPEVFLVLVSGSNPVSDTALSQHLGIADRVRFLPATSELARYYAMADLFLYPTPYDTFGMVISEAMASRLPVITSPAAGAAELIEHGISGVLTRDAGNPDELANAVRSLQDAHLREKLGNAARTALEKFTWDRTAEETLAVYRELLAKR